MSTQLNNQNFYENMYWNHFESQSVVKDDYLIAGVNEYFTEPNTQIMYTKYGFEI